MKKTFLAFILVVALCLPTFVACGNKVEVGTETEYAVADIVYTPIDREQGDGESSFYFVEISENGLPLSFGVCNGIVHEDENENCFAPVATFKKHCDFKYDENGVLLAIIDHACLGYRYEVDKYDKEGRPKHASAVGQTDPKSASYELEKNLSYNDSGALGFSYGSDRAGVSGSTFIGKYGRITIREDIACAAVYDEDNRTLLSAELNGNKWSYTYNPQGYCETALCKNADGELEYTFTYDADNKLTGYSKETQDGKKTEYKVTYDSNGKITEVKEIK